MKICFTSTGETMESKLDPRFGRCKYFIIYDTETKEHKTVENSGAISAHGAGVSAAQQVEEAGVDVVITGKLGPNAMNILSAANINGFSGNQVSLEENLKLYEEGKLEKITKPGKAHHGM
ncbi:NifB/NifX family molybdenum-iron cluster-binding protein [Caldisalinibacter kiritimatiensis]|uniref:Dinitrogenase iron-molybdenum cofactor biosynthesis domain-containing protein n=1 Tax=Caldisalinibacter kiritimatiensis TaxID=1304284 RepID=R1AXH5_9FIRM|nr:NifB/NifX family molybdenum-iron cluster-binding protein [Caldisalinibacter kiritimatiensis]EOD01357.1 hypothetical protein L21TH_0578 [Caldisalinibacter kiritimatiensis]